MVGEWYCFECEKKKVEKIWFVCKVCFVGNVYEILKLRCRVFIKGLDVLSLESESDYEV